LSWRQGGSSLQASIEALRPQGHISVVGFLSGVSANLNLIALNLKRATLTGVSVGSREDYEDMLAAISQHNLRPVIGATFALENTQEAFAFLKSGGHFGKVVITLDDGGRRPSGNSGRA
jgi:NADPH:quinone reductase-like Zn-dependent oxidoreductase